MANRGTLYRSRDLSMHKPGVIPHSSRRISPITASRHKYDLKQRGWSKKSAESWFETHSPEDRRAVYSFLDTLHGVHRPANPPPPSSATKLELGEMIQSLERYRPSSSTAQEKSVETGPLPDVARPKTSLPNESDRAGRRYLSQTWRVLNPRDDVETNVRPEHNSSSFFNYTKKVQPEYFFIHPDWY